MRKLILFSVITFFIISCKTNKKKVDMIVHNALIYSVNSDFQKFESFAVKNGKFIDVGQSKDILEKYQSKNEIDMHGKTIFPGFFDAHCHFYGYGQNLQKADLRGTKSFDEVIQKVKEFSEKHDVKWVLGRGWDQNDWEIKKFPVNTRLNELFPNTPVVLTRVDGHAILANEEALKRSGITTETKVKGGKFLVQKSKLTGVLIDNAQNKIYQAIPPLNKAIKTNALLAAQKACFAVGLTTVDDAGLSKETVLLIDELQKTGSLKIRVYAMLNPSKENVEHFIEKGTYKTDLLNVRSVKLYADGALGSRGACLIHPYSDDLGNTGFLISGIDFLDRFCKLAYENNYQINTHAIGDSANRVMLNLYSKYLKKENNKRWRVEHAQVISFEDFNLFSKFSIIPSVQPTHATSDMYWAEDRLGSERVKYAYAYKKLLELIGWIAAGSDFPVEDINPLYGFYAAVARQDQKAWPENGFQMENAISREQALKAMTIWAAKSNFEEKEKGSIEIGKFADFVVTDEDIMEIEIHEIPKVKVLETYIAGEKVY